MSLKAKADYIHREVMPKVKPLDIIVTADFDWWNPITWSSRFIRQKTGSKWSHVLVVGLNGYCYTTDLHFKKCKLDEFLVDKDSFLIKRLPELTELQQKEGLIACEKEIGKLYPFIDVLSLVVQNTIDPGAYRLKVDSKDKICSQFVSWLYRDVMKVDLAPQLDQDISMFTPKDCIDDARLRFVAAWI